MSDDLQEYEDLLHEKLKRKRSHLNRIPSQDFEPDVYELFLMVATQKLSRNDIIQIQRWIIIAQENLLNEKTK